MSVARKLERVSVEEYLAGELTSETKHEYVGGFVYAMSGGRNRHNRIATNAVAALWVSLRGHQCQAYNSDTKIRVRLPGHTRLSYPDASVVCRPNPPDDVYQDEPVLLVEVLSTSTRRLDFGEKKEAYLSIPSLEVYLLAEPRSPKVMLFRRTDTGFEPETWEGLESSVPIPSLGINLALSDLYAGVSFVE